MGIISSIFKKLKKNKLVETILVQPQSIKHIFRIYTESFLLALFVAFVLRFFIVSTYKVSTSALEPELKRGDYLISFKLPFSLPLSGEAKRKGNLQFIESESLVIYSCLDNAEKSCVGKVVALPTQEIKKEYQDTVENYGMRQFVPSGKLLVFHKNSPTYKERVKQVPIENLEGKPFMIWLSVRPGQEPESKQSSSINWQRFFKFL